MASDDLQWGARDVNEVSWGCGGAQGALWRGEPALEFGLLDLVALEQWHLLHEQADLRYAQRALAGHEGVYVIECDRAVLSLAGRPQQRGELAGEGGEGIAQLRRRPLDVDVDAICALERESY